MIISEAEAGAKFNRHGAGARSRRDDEILYSRKRFMYNIYNKKNKKATKTRIQE